MLCTCRVTRLYCVFSHRRTRWIQIGGGGARCWRRPPTLLLRLTLGCAGMSDEYQLLHVLGWKEEEATASRPRTLLCHGSVALPELLTATYSDASLSIPLALYSAQTPLPACGELENGAEEGGEGRGGLRAVGRVLQLLTQKKGAGEGAVHEEDGAGGTDWWTVPLAADVVKGLEAAVEAEEGRGTGGKHVESAVVYEARGCWWQTQVSAEAAGVLGGGAEEGMGMGVGLGIAGERRVRVRLPPERQLLATVDVQLILTRTQVPLPVRASTGRRLVLALHRPSIR
jgi:hypothetical protein